MRLALISKSRAAGLFVPLGPPPGLILTVGHIGCNQRCANLAVNAFLVPPQLYTVGIDINVKIADMAYSNTTNKFTRMTDRSPAHLFQLRSCHIKFCSLSNHAITDIEGTFYINNKHALSISER